MQQELDTKFLHSICTVLHSEVDRKILIGEIYQKLKQLQLSSFKIFNS